MEKKKKSLRSHAKLISEVPEYFMESVFVVNFELIHFRAALQSQDPAVVICENWSQKRDEISLALWTFY